MSKKISTRIIWALVLFSSLPFTPIYGQNYSQSSGTTTVSGKTYSSSSSDVNSVKVSGGTFTMTNCTITKTGDTGNSDNSSFYGTNAAVLSSSSGIINMTGGSITTNCKGANGIVAYGGTVNVSGVTINCSQNLSRGIHATGGGTITATNLSITTAGSNSSVIALDRGGGTVTVTDGTYSATGKDCAICYSTGNLTVNNITGSSSQGEFGVIEGDNYITINNSNLTSGASSSSRGLMILQSGSGDAGTGINGVISVKGGSLTMTESSTPLIEIVTNVNGKVTLDGVTTTIPSGVLMKVDYNTRWSTKGATGILFLAGSGTTYNGDIVADSYCKATVTVKSGVVWKGAFDKQNTAKASGLTVKGDGEWSLTETSYVDTINVSEGISGTTCTNITGNGYNVYYDSSLSANAYLNGKSYNLVNGGYLAPISSVGISNIEFTKELNLNSYPNPIISSANISFTIPSQSYVSLKVYDINGKVVDSLINQIMASGFYTVKWTPKLPGGIYFCQLVSKNNRATRKLVIEK